MYIIIRIVIKSAILVLLIKKIIHFNQQLLVHHIICRPKKFKA